MIAPHHPDRLRRPVPNPATVVDDRTDQALIWNVFRTLELLPPAFWLRRLHARLFGMPFTPAPEVVRIGLWRRLPLPPARLLDSGPRDVLIDVTIETEHAVWTLSSISDGQRRCQVLESEFVADLLDAGCWRAGARHSFIGFIERSPAEVGTVWKTRYSRSQASSGIRSSRGSTPRSAHIGALRWVDLAAILLECAEADVLAHIDRSLARNVVNWLERCGIS